MKNIARLLIERNNSGRKNRQCSCVSGNGQDGFEGSDR